jgi:hypothetical protein
MSALHFSIEAFPFHQTNQKRKAKMRNTKTLLLPLMLLCFSFSLQAGVHRDTDKTQKPQAAPTRAASETLMNLEHNTGNLRVGIFNDGSIGADNVTFAGPGVSWKGQNGAFTGGLIFGSTQRGRVNGLMGFLPNASVYDVQNVASDFAAGFQAGAGFNQTTNATLNDAGAPLPYGVEILQRSYSNTGEDFVIMRYGFVNQSGGELTDFFAGIHIDWDIGSATTNSGGYALEENLVYNFDLGPGPNYYGIAALNGLSGMMTTTFGSNANTLRGDAFAYLATIDANPIGNAGDYRSWAGTGPFDIAAGDTAWVTFALVAGDDLSNIRANARSAATKASALGWTQPSFHANAVPQQNFTQITNDILATDLEFSSGVSWGDYNNDGFQDMLVSNFSPMHGASLYKNNGDGTFMKITNGEVASDAGQSFSATWGDYDNDGYLDLYISNGGTSTSTPPLTRNFLYRNQGPPSYDLVRVKSGAIVADSSYTWSSAWVDYDNDGDLDLHAPASQRLAGNPDLFYENAGAGNFTRVTALPFLNAGVTRTLGSSWIDYDNDGDQDLLLSKDGADIGGEAKQLWKNLLKESGQVAFEQIATGELVTDMLLDFSASWGDYDNDGDPDLFVSVFGGNNVLYRNDIDSGGGFTRIQTGILTNDGRNTAGSAWVDFDNDGDLDMFITNTGQISRLYRNDGKGNFFAISPAQMGVPLLLTPSNGQGCAWADYDRDGDLDLYVANATTDGINPDPNSFFRNDGGNNNNWSQISCIGTTSNRSAFGAKVRLKATIFGKSYWQTRFILGGLSGDRGQNSLVAHFGLGDATVIDSLRLEWPSGQIDHFTNLAANRFLTVEEGGVISGITQQPSTALPRDFALKQNYPNPFNPTTRIAFALPVVSHVTLTVFDMNGRVVTELIRNQLRTAGRHEVSFSANDLASGIYFYKLEARSNNGSLPQFIETKTMTYLK